MNGRILAVALAALLAGPAFAADFRIGSETLLTPPALDAAAEDQSKPSLAWYGDSLVATWLDSRWSSIRLAHLDLLGRPRSDDPVAARVAAPLFDARIASSGAATPLMAMTYFGTTYVGPAGTSGNGFRGDLGDLVTDGSTYLLLTRDSRLTASILDAHGETLHVLSIDTSHRGITKAIGTTLGGDYHVVYMQDDCGVGCSPAIHDAIVKSSATSSDQLLVPKLPVSTKFSATAAGDRLLVAWTTPDSIELMLLTAQRSLVAQTHLDIKADDVFAGSDGGQFLVAWTAAGSLEATRMSTSGRVDTSRFVISSATPRELTFGHTPAGVVLAWAEGTSLNVVTRGASSFDAIAAAPNVIASLGYAQQLDVQLVTNGSAPIAFWSEGETSPRILSSAGASIVADAGHSLRNPRAAVGGGTSVVAWRDVDDKNLVRLMARVGNGLPIVLGGPFTAADAVTHDVVFDGNDFLVVWNERGIQVARFTPSGERRGSIVIPQADARLPRAVRTTSGVLIAFANQSTVQTFRVSSAGGRLTADTPRPIWFDGFVRDIAVAADEQLRPFIIWTAADKKNVIYGARMIDEGLFVAGQFLTDTDDTYALDDPALAWSGSEFVIGWTARRPSAQDTVRILRVTREGNAIDAKPQDLTGIYRHGFGPSIASSATGVTIAYQRVASEEPFDDVARVFLRTLDRLGTVPRMRGIGHKLALNRGQTVVAARQDLDGISQRSRSRYSSRPTVAPR
jgi:hypothetical protein